VERQSKDFDETCAAREKYEDWHKVNLAERKSLLVRGRRKILLDWMQPLIPQRTRDASNNRRV